MSSKSLPIVLALLAGSPAFAQLTLEPYWSIAPVNATTFPDSNSLTRGGSFNPTTGNLLVASRAGITGVHILNGATGIETGTLNMTGITGGTFALNMISVAADGAIYGANLVTASSAGSPFKIYRWANEAAAPTVVYSGDPGAGRYGDSFSVRGSGTSTEIIAGQGGSGVATATRLVHLGTADGSTFTAATLNVSGITGGDLRLGLDFGPGNTVYGKQAGALRFVSYDLGAATAALTASFTLTSPNGAIPGPIGIYGDTLVAYAYNGSESSQIVNVYSISNLLTSGSNSPLDSEVLGSANANNNGVGAVDFNADGTIVYVVAPNNGVTAYRLIPEPGTWALLGCGVVLLGWSIRCRS